MAIFISSDYYMNPFVSAEPEVRCMVERTNKDEFLILASDGLWDKVSNEVVSKIAGNCFNGRTTAMFLDSVSGSSATDAAALLADAELSISRGSMDNINVVVVKLRRLKTRAA
ncbi:protein phosphatase 2C 51-like [Oryza brachyantha]|uniref:protein phosphatase 2C 51-like n=1 Tax=Oryza brachyantha TaxID=4533 RepID=UPI001ADB0993|nr:protein phosphatase 2C 51-like [Oryza brachyantha]